MTEKFDIVHAGEALQEVQAPVTPRSIKHKGGDANPSVALLQAQFASAVVRSEVVWGESTVYITPASVTDVMRWLHDDPGQRYDYLSDVTAVEYRDFEAPVEVVWHGGEGLVGGVHGAGG